MSRQKTTIQVLLVAAIMLIVAGTSAEARGVDGRTKAQVVTIEKRSPSFWQWVKIKLSRYAMAAN